MNNKSKIFFSIATLALVSCHNPVFDDEGDCEVHYYMRFVYDMNLKWADAFPSEVNSVNLYTFDKEGLFVKEFLGRGEDLSFPGYEIELDLDPGEYQFVAWCGLYNDGKDMESFSVPSPQVGVTTIEQLTCSLNTLSNSLYSVYSDSMLHFMYHGFLSENLPDSQNGASYYYTMPLVKDTNHVRIILQQLSGENMSPDDFDFSISAVDGILAYDNSILGDVNVEYLPWNKQVGEAGIGKIDTENNTGSLIYVDGVIADITMCRLMADQKDDVRLVISNAKTEETIANVPIIQYALLSKEYYESAYRHSMTDQEFLDREDEYILTFFLDQDLKWISSVILIQSWRIVLHDYEVGE